jgi:hypothetical protein
MTTYILVLALIVEGNFTIGYRGEYKTLEQCAALAQEQKIPQGTTAARAFCLTKETI